MDMLIVKKTTLLIVVFSAIFCCAMLDANEKDKMENKLRERIAGVYQAYKERKFDKFIDFSTIDHSDREKRKKISDEMREAYPILVDYEIKEIIITGDKAKVKVAITLILDDEKDVSDSFDYWIFKNNEWYLFDFGKIQ